MNARKSPDYHVIAAISTEQPQPAEENDLSTEAKLAALKASISALQESIHFSKDPAFYDAVRARFASDQATCAYIAKSIAEGVAAPLQGEYYSAIRSVLTFHTRAKEITEAMELAWFDFHYGGEPSRLLLRLQVSSRNDLSQGNKERLALVLSLLQSGYTAASGTEELRAAVREILTRREAFKQRTLAGASVSLISLEDSERFAPGEFTKLAETIGTDVQRITGATADSPSAAFYAKVARSDPDKPLTIVLTAHGMAQAGGYLTLPKNERITPPQFAAALQARGNADNVTILSTQCYPRSSRLEDSFFDNLTQQCRQRNIGAPAVYMESTENQPAVLNPQTNPEGNAFQTLRLAAASSQDTQIITGADILRAANDVIGNQPSLIIPANGGSKLPLKNEVANRTPDSNITEEIV